MRLIMVFLIAFAGRAWSGTEVNCDVIDGFYQNSSTPISSIKFETAVDIFTINNARVLSMNLNGRDIHFSRSDISVHKGTKLIYLQRRNRQAVRAASVHIDRTPRQIVQDGEFFGNMLISDEIPPGADFTAILSGNNVLAYNFYCRI